MSLPPYAVDNKYVLKQTDTDIKWRHGKPDYSKTIALYTREKTANHKPESLEEIVENIVKNWEVEVSHKIDPEQWETVDLENYRFSCNGLSKFTAYDLVKIGTYNALIGKTIYYNGHKLTLSESQMAFQRTFSEGFAWELIELYSGPPHVTFKWRHFGKMTGYFSCPSYTGYVYKAEPTHKMVNIYGICKATVSADLKIQDLQAYFDINQLFAQFTELCPLAPFANATSMMDLSTEKVINEPAVNNLTTPSDQADVAMNNKNPQTNQNSSTCNIL